MSEIEFRRLSAGDAAVLGRVAEDVFDEPVDPVRLAAYLSQPGHHMIVAIHDGVVVGQTAAVVHRHPDKPTELYIDEVGVAAGLPAAGHRAADARADVGASARRSAARRPGSAPSRTMLRRGRSTNAQGAAWAGGGVRDVCV